MFGALPVSILELLPTFLTQALPHRGAPLYARWQFFSTYYLTALATAHPRFVGEDLHLGLALGTKEYFGAEFAGVLPGTPGYQAIFLKVIR
jgi:hypothetical protein